MGHDAPVSETKATEYWMFLFEKWGDQISLTVVQYSRGSDKFSCPSDIACSCQGWANRRRLVARECLVLAVWEG